MIWKRDSQAAMAAVDVDGEDRLLIGNHCSGA